MIPRSCNAAGHSHRSSPRPYEWGTGIGCVLRTRGPPSLRVGARADSLAGSRADHWQKGVPDLRVTYTAGQDVPMIRLRTWSTPDRTRIKIIFTTRSLFVPRRPSSLEVMPQPAFCNHCRPAGPDFSLRTWTCAHQSRHPLKPPTSAATAR
jgi:hypothetical protein